jgi:hypothetical protein
MGDNVPPCIQSRNDMLAKLLGVTTTSGNPYSIGMRERWLDVAIVLVMASLHLVVHVILYLIMTRTSRELEGT